MHAEVMLMVHDVSKSAAWYRQLLEATNDHGGDEFDRIVADGRVLLMLHRHSRDDEHGVRAPEGASEAGRGVALWLHVPDLAAVRERARGMAAEMVSEPWFNPQAQHTEFTLHDPDGYTVVITQA
jgi:hypothetical protein